tara:strand:- start:3106 stop:3459 length:354 start_codon:yes stop_codon:yes gene_type:complete
MSTLKVNDIEEATAGGGKIFLNRVWNVWNQSGTQAIIADGNVSSITDNGTGSTTTTYTNNLSSSNYAVSCGAGSSSTDPYRYLGVWNTMTTSAVRTQTLYSATSAYDAQYNAIQIVL